jgi:hypothetical protein
METDGVGLDIGRRPVAIGAGAALLTAWLPACSGPAESKQEDSPGPLATADEPLRRKQRSEARLRDEGVPILDSLPVIESESEARLRSARAVADRLLALTLVAVKAEGMISGETPESVRAMIESAIAQRKAERLFTADEQAFVRNLRPDRDDQIRFQWRYEAAWVLLWALRWVDGPLSPPRQPCDVPRLSGIVHDRLDLAARGIRRFGEILDEADLIYRYHWATEDARFHGRDWPAGLDQDVVVERHQALNWLIGYQGQEWDAVTTDT